MVFRIISGKKIKLSLVQAEEIKQLSQSGRLTESELMQCLQTGEKKAVPKKFALDKERLKTYFAGEYTEQEMTEVIFCLLDEWKKAGVQK